MEEVRFQNVDLELVSRVPHDPLIAAMGDDLHVLSNVSTPEGYFAGLEIDSGLPEEPERSIAAFCDVVEAMPSEARLLWDGCTSKRFDLGFGSGSGDRVGGELSIELLQRVAALGATIAWTIYPVHED